MPRSAVAVPPLLARRANKVLRPVDAAGAYANPRAELARLRRSGAVLRLATGYYALLPQDRLGDQSWRPDLEAAALGLAQSDYGVDGAALMGVSAARYHGAIPRALAVAVLAVPKQRPAVETEVGRIMFVKRNIARLDVEHIETRLTSGWVTTVEQTLLDLADRPALGGLERSDMDDAVRFLAGRADWALVRQLASAQHKPTALRNATLIAEPRHA
jgi:predicted transcriptional regulator of viral defense system